MKEETIDIILDSDLYDQLEKAANGQSVSDYIVNILTQCVSNIDL